MPILLDGTNSGSAPSSEAIFRSAPMGLVQFYVTIELARDMVYALGKTGTVHFRDLNLKLTPFQRTFVNEIRKLDVTDTQLGHLRYVMDKYGVGKGDPYFNLEEDSIGLPTSSEMDDIRSQVADFYERTKQLDDAYTSLDAQRLTLQENKYVVLAVNDFQKSSLLGAGGDEPRMALFEIEDDLEDATLLANGRLEENMVEMNLMEEFGFNMIVGSLAREKVALLRSILWRTTRGNMYFNDIPIEDEALYSKDERDGSERVYKNVVLVYVHGEYLKLRTTKIITSLNGKIYDNVQGGASARLQTLDELSRKIGDFQTVIEETLNHLRTELTVLQDSFAKYSYIIKREKMVYDTLNMFDQDSTRRCLVGEGWIPKSDYGSTRQIIKNLVRDKTSRSLIGTEIDLEESIELETANSEETAQPLRRGPGLVNITNDNHLFVLGHDEDDLNSHRVHQFDEDDDEYSTSLVAVMNELSTNKTPPTFHRTNKFTSAFQLIIDAYGIATYQEVNPGLATIITFPFMFAIMFGDLGHGFILFLMSLYLVANERSFGLMRNKDEIFEMAFNGRYILLLMGIFSMYTGFIYNDIFSKSMTIFKSGWAWEFPEGYSYVRDGPVTLIAKKIPGKTYWMGLDWAWHGAENSLLFTNSYKMKLSILMGFIHMNYSLFFSLVNYRFFKSRVDIIGNFIPGFLFMQSIFGYLSLTIIYKWSVDWLGKGWQPPGLLNMLINMFLSPGNIQEPLYRGQKYIQLILVAIALVCVPWLLLYKPLTLRKQNSQAIKLGYSDLRSQMSHNLQMHEEEEAINFENNMADDDIDFEILSDDDNGEFRFPNDVEQMHHSAHGGGHGHGEDEFNFGDIVIHQVIHTIEFCLNCVSHTASYLRLWALSLAHAQLSSVLWSMTIQNAFGATGKKGIFMTVVLFGMWFLLTVCILVLMEGTSAMLHSLRLHWVEAMSKFFEGEGYEYQPFTFKSIDL